MELMLKLTVFHFVCVCIYIYIYIYILSAVVEFLASSQFYSFFFVFQFDCTNTLNDQLLEHVTVDMEAAEGFEMVKQIACPSLRYNKPGTTYTLARLPDDPTAGSVESVTVNRLEKECTLQVAWRV